MVRRKVARSCGINSPVSRFFETVRLPGAMPAQLTRMRSTPFAAAGLGEAPSHRGLVGHVGDAEDRADLAGDLFAALGVHVEDGDLGAFGGEQPRRRLAQAGSAAGDDGCHRFVELHAFSPC